MDIISNKKYIKYNRTLFCGFNCARLERFRFRYYYNSITCKQASGMEWAIYSLLQLLNETVQRENISIIIKVISHSFE